MPQPFVEEPVVIPLAVTVALGVLFALAVCHFKTWTVGRSDVYRMLGASILAGTIVGIGVGAFVGNAILIGLSGAYAGAAGWYLYSCLQSPSWQFRWPVDVAMRFCQIALLVLIGGLLVGAVTEMISGRVSAHDLPGGSVYLGISSGLFFGPKNYKFWAVLVGGGSGFTGWLLYCLLTTT